MKASKEQPDIQYKGLTLHPNKQIGVDSNGNPVYAGLIIKAFLEMKEKLNKLKESSNA